MNQIAVLLTCYNRKTTTIRCLEQLFVFEQSIDVYLVDDNSSDGTWEAVASQFPKMILIKGTGSLFWNRGMYFAWEHASTKEYDFYLWLNDDVVLYENCFTELLECSELSKGNAIISGIVESHDKTETLYGGTDKNKKLLHPNGTLQAIRNMNGNIVLVPSAVFKVLGNLDPLYHHDLGDVDYGLRAIESGFSVVTTRVAIGSGDKNDFCRVRLQNSSLVNRFKRLYSPLGNNPKINFHFRKKHYGVLNAIIYFIHIHFINILPDSLIKIIFGNRYT